jgi:SWI/SNF-related matrix-associated actin-dependent regulator of chromatin subfamily A3
MKFHGRNRDRDVTELDTCDLVLTTYNTVSAEWKARSNKSCLFAIKWRRIALDEGRD